MFSCFMFYVLLFSMDLLCLIQINVCMYVCKTPPKNPESRSRSRSASKTNFSLVVRHIPPSTKFHKKESTTSANFTEFLLPGNGKHSFRNSCICIVTRSPHIPPGQCSNYMQARVCRAPSLLVRAPILSEIFGVQRGPA